MLVGFEAEFDPQIETDVKRFVELYAEIAAKLNEQQEKEGRTLQLKIKMTKGMSERVKGAWQQEGVTSVSEAAVSEELA